MEYFKWYFIYYAWKNTFIYYIGNILIWQPSMHFLIVLYKFLFCSSLESMTISSFIKKIPSFNVKKVAYLEQMWFLKILLFCYMCFKNWAMNLDIMLRYSNWGKYLRYILYEKKKKLSMLSIFLILFLIFL